MKNYTITVNGNVYDVTVEEATGEAFAAPSRKLFGLAINGPKSVIAPTPIKIRDGRMLHSSNRKK